MKTNQLFFFFLVLLFSTSLRAQLVQGVITYEMRMDMHRTLPADRPELRTMIPQHRTENFELFFTPTESFYKIKEDPAQMAAGGGGGPVRVMMRSPRSETYIDRRTNERLVFLDFMGRNLLIVDTIGVQPWRIGNEQMEIAGYMCMMAWQTDTVTNQEITVWFAPGLPPFLGPDRFSTLPGTVLAVDINNGERVWVARNIESREIRTAELRKPTRGERITRAQFNKLVEEQMQRMNPGGGGAAAIMRFF